MKKKNLTEQRITVEEPQEVYAAANLLGEIRAATSNPGRVRIDLRGAERIHTAVLQVLIAAHRSSLTLERPLFVCGAAPALQIVLQMAGLPISDAM